MSLGIRHVGGTVARLLAREFGSMEALRLADEDTLAAIEGIGPVIAKSVAEWFADEANQNLVRRLGEGEVRLSDPDWGQGPEKTLQGVRLVLTGSLESMTRAAARVRRGGTRRQAGVVGVEGDDRARGGRVSRIEAVQGGVARSEGHRRSRVPAPA